MTREEFIKRFTIAGAGLAFMPAFLASCKEEEINVSFSGKVLIIGGGTAGMFAAYTLNHFGIDFELIEAKNRFGGRVHELENFADFPIDLGAEWIHGSPSLPAEMLEYGDHSGSYDIIPYNPETIQLAKDGNLTEVDVGTHFYGENKWKNSTWFQFLEDNIASAILAKTIFNKQVQSIDYSLDHVVVTTTDSNTYTADKVICTVPIKILQEEHIQFIPELSSDVKNAYNGISMPDGIKIFAKFSEKFYPDLLLTAGISSAAEKTYYNAAFKKDSGQNVLALFSVGEPSTAFTSLASDQERIDLFLSELDALYDGKASETLLGYVVKNWSADPHVLGSYSFYESGFYEHQQVLRAGIDQKIYFAGEALSVNQSSTVHGAAESGTEVAESILQGG